MTNILEIEKAVENGQLKIIPELVQNALNAGCEPGRILNDGFICAMDKVGEKFKTGEAYVPEMLVAARGMKIGMDVLKPHLVENQEAKHGKCIIGTVEGDLHDVGKNLVAMIIESKGFEIIDLGVDVPHAKFVEAIKDNPDCKVVALSALLTTTMGSMKEAVRVISDAGLRDQVKILVGGAPITQAFADEIGADGFAAEAASAANTAKTLVS